MRKSIAVAAAILLIAFAGACGKEKQADLEKLKSFEIANFDAKTAPPKPVALPQNQVVVVPDDIKGKYKAVTVAIGNRKTKEVKQFKVKIGGEAAVPGTNYRIKVMSYLPNWTMRGNVVTSKDDKQLDPAIRATIFENGKQVFDGFIFQRHETPSFMTEDYAIGLLGAS